MRIHLVQFDSARDFLHHYDEMDGDGGLIFATKAKFRSGEQVALEVRFPPMVGRVLVTATSSPHMAPEGYVAFRFLAEEQSKKEFLLRVAHLSGEPKSFPRHHRRFPVRLRLNWQVEGVAFHHIGEVRNLSRGGLFVVSEWAPPVGTRLSLTIKAPDDPNPIRVRGKVTWVSHGGKQVGMGLRFEKRSSPDMKRLRTIIRAISHSGDLDAVPTFVSKVFSEQEHT
ncbi:MAG: PilZ domain-containing protein [Deltaproteobacteria bacterium]|nr:PilZ domain-containing protein [Deltaproteobacteria bacterium]